MIKEAKDVERANELHYKFWLETGGVYFSQLGVDLNKLCSNGDLEFRKMLMDIMKAHDKPKDNE